MLVRMTYIYVYSSVKDLNVGTYDLYVRIFECYGLECKFICTYMYVRM